MRQTVGFKSMSKMEKRTLRATPANLPIAESDSRPPNNFEGCRPDLFSQTLGALKCELAVEFVKITDMEFGIERSFHAGDPLRGRNRRKF
jgi:hypothetical protein